MAAAFAFDSIHARRAALLYWNDAYGRDWTRVFRNEFARRGGAVAARDRSFGGPNYVPIMGDYVRVLGADVVVVPARLSGPKLLEKLGARPDTINVITGDSDGGCDFGAELGRLPNYYHTAIFPNSFPAPRSAPLRRDLPTTPSAACVGGLQVPAYAFDAALTIGRAVLAVGPGRARVRDYVESLGRTGRRFAEPPGRSPSTTIMTSRTDS